METSISVLMLVVNIVMFLSGFIEDQRRGTEELNMFYIFNQLTLHLPLLSFLTSFVLLFLLFFYYFTLYPFTLFTVCPFILLFVYYDVILCSNSFRIWLYVS